jgi:rubrerythrin
MSDLQKAEAILRLAIQTEMDGHEFYQKAAQRTADPAGQELFRRLAADEVEHRQLLETQMTALQAGKGWQSHEALPTHTAGASLFYQERLAQNVNAYTADLSALRTALLIETDAVTFYGKAAEQAGDDRARSLFRDLVKMEQGHQSALQRQYDFLLGQFRDVMGFAPF